MSMMLVHDSQMEDWDLRIFWESGAGMSVTPSMPL